jgi:hypothetical protein
MSAINEKADLGVAVQQVESTMSHEDLKTSNVEYERSQLLANLPDPDHGKSEEEKKAIDKKLMRKVDLWLVPWLSFLYAISYCTLASLLTQYQIPALLPRQSQHRQRPTSWHGGRSWDVRSVTL